MLLEDMIQYLELQDEWIDRTYPGKAERKPTTNFSDAFISSGPAYILLVVAHWDSPEQQGEWINSNEFIKARDYMAKHVLPGDHPTELCLQQVGKEVIKPPMLAAWKEFDVHHIAFDSVSEDQDQHIRHSLWTLMMEHGDYAWGGWRFPPMESREEVIIFTASGEDLAESFIKDLNLRAKTDKWHFKPFGLVD